MLKIKLIIIKLLELFFLWIKAGPRPNLTEKIIDQYSVQRKPPSNAIEEDHKLFRHEYDRSFNEVRTYLFRNVYLNSLGLIFNRYGCFRKSCTQPAFIKRFGFSYLTSLFKNANINTYKNKETYVAAFDQWSHNNYFHWMTDTLPRVQMVKDKYGKEAVFIFPDNYTAKYVTKSLSALDVNYIFFKQTEIIKIKKLMFPDYVAPTGNYYPEIMLRLRKSILASQFPDADLKKPSDLIYVSRKKANFRYVLNEQEVMDILAPAGFKVVYFEDLSWEEQIKIANNTKVMISITGANLTNLLYMQAKSVVLEFRRQQDSLNNCYYNLCDALNIKFYFQCCETEETKPGNYFNLKVDLDLLKKNVNLMLSDQHREQH